jgi:hypothetical protein
MNNRELVLQVNKELALTLSEKISMEELRSQLAIYVNHLILHNFEQLVSLLYRIDVSEAKIKSFLSRQTDENAGDIIASLIIERQLQKIKSREQFKQQDNNFEEEEKW